MLRGDGFTDIQLRPGSGGIFDVELDGSLIYSKHQTGRHADPAEILDLLRASR